VHACELYTEVLVLFKTFCFLRLFILYFVQKYRSHRKHLLAREAEAASWSQRRQMYGAPGGGGGKRDMSPWLAPTMGFPPMHHFRPLHVWGHPTMDQSLMPMWPKHLAHSPSPPPPPPTTWLPAPPPPPPDPSYWHHHHQRVSSLSLSFIHQHKQKHKTLKTINVNDLVPRWLD
jgi:hypothetical protein